MLQENDLDDLYDYIARTSPITPSSLSIVLIEAVVLLKDHPRLGRHRCAGGAEEREDVRELIFQGLSRHLPLVDIRREGATS